MDDSDYDNRSQTEVHQERSGQPCNVYHDNVIGGRARVHFGNVYNTYSQDGVSEAEQSRKEKEAFLKSLSFPELENRIHNIEAGLDNTCRWLLDHDYYRTWETAEHDEDDVRVLWLRGKPGSGKSTIMKQAFQTTRSHASSSKGVAVVSHFFNTRGSPLEASIIGFYRSVLHQLFAREAFDITEAVMEFNRKSLYIAQGWEWTEGELCTMFQRSLLQASANVILFIDALDECTSSSSRRLIDLLSKMLDVANTENKSFKICLSSRHYPNFQIKRCLTVVAEHCNQYDIESYTRDKLLELGQDALYLCPKITRDCAGVFLWVVLVAQRIREAVDDGSSRYKLDQILLSVPRDLETLFNDLVLSIPENERSQSRLLMQWILFAKRPLTAEELGTALLYRNRHQHSRNYEELTREMTKDKIRRFLNKMSRGLIELTGDGKKGIYRREPVVQLIHESVREYLLFRGGLQVLDPSVGHNLDTSSNNELARSCFHYLWVEDRCLDTVVRKYLWNWELAERFPFLTYARDYAFVHAKEAEKQGSDQSYIVEGFKYGQDQLFKSWKDSRNGYEPRVSQWSFLDFCCYYGLRSCAERLLSQSASRGIALWNAVSRGHKEVAVLLLQNGVEDHITDRIRGDVVYIALSEEQDNMLDILIRYRVNLNAIGPFGTPLIFASLRGYERYVRILLENGANVKIIDADYGDALLCASSEGYAKVVDLLLDHGAKALTISRYKPGSFSRGRTHALLEASGWGHTSIVELLLQKAEKNIQSYRSALQAARFANRTDVATLLENAIIKKAGKKALTYLEEPWSESLTNETGIQFPRTAVSKDEVSITVHTLTGRYQTFKIRQNLQCIDLKEHIRLKEGLTHDDQYLTYRNRFVAEEEYLSDRGIGEGAVVELLLPIWTFRRLMR